jgi:hypothetical protein
MIWHEHCHGVKKDRKRSRQDAYIVQDWRKIVSI